MRRRCQLLFLPVLPSWLLARPPARLTPACPLACPPTRQPATPHPEMMTLHAPLRLPPPLLSLPFLPCKPCLPCKPSLCGLKHMPHSLPLFPLDSPARQPSARSHCLPCSTLLTHSRITLALVNTRQAHQFASLCWHLRGAHVAWPIHPQVASLLALWHARAYSDAQVAANRAHVRNHHRFCLATSSTRA